MSESNVCRYDGLYTSESDVRRYDGLYTSQSDVRRYDGLYTSQSDVCTRQILTYKDDPRAERVNIKSTHLINTWSHSN